MKESLKKPMVGLKKPIVHDVTDAMVSDVDELRSTLVYGLEEYREELNNRLFAEASVRRTDTVSPQELIDVLREVNRLTIKRVYQEKSGDPSKTALGFSSEVYKDLKKMVKLDAILSQPDHIIVLLSMPEAMAILMADLSHGEKIRLPTSHEMKVILSLSSGLLKITPWTHLRKDLEVNWFWLVSICLLMFIIILLLIRR